MLNPITENQFSIYVLPTRSRYANILAEEVSWFKNETDTVFGLILLDSTDRDYTGMILIRDKNNEVRHYRQEIDFKSVGEAKEWLREQEETLAKTPGFIKSQKRFLERQKDSLFAVKGNVKNLNPSFEALNNCKGYSPAKELISKIMPCYRDVDGNFKQQFQTDGFDARLWELYLYCYFAEEGMRLNRDYPAPDFCIGIGKEEICVEAVTLNRSQGGKTDAGKADRDPLEEINEIMPVKYGNALRKKLNHQDANQRHYWEHEHTKGKPFVLAIADFHEEQSMMWTTTSLMKYLYGYDTDYTFDEEGCLEILPKKIPCHTVDGKQIPSGFFFQEGTEQISAVLFSAGGTVAKFNRIGKQCGFGDPDIRMFRHVLVYDENPNAVKPKSIRYEVTEDYSEMWAEGVVIYHNPNAACPLPFDFFAYAVQGWFDGEYLNFTTENLMVYSSFTSTVCVTK